MRLLCSRAMLASLVVGLVSCAWHRSHVEPLHSLAAVLDITGFRGTVVVYDLRRNRMQATHPALVDAARIPASTFKIVNSLIALETGVVTDERTVICWDSVVRPRVELNRDLDLATGFRLSAVPHFRALARAIGYGRMQHFVGTLNYGNRNIAGGIDQFWLTGDLRISPREQIDFLMRLYRDELPVSRQAMATVRRIMEVERSDGFMVRAKTGWAVLPNDHEVGWWVGWVERGSDVYFFASMIEGDNPGATFGAARTEVPRAVLHRLGILPHAG